MISSGNGFRGGSPGPIIVDVRGSRLGLGCGIAHKIMVKEVTDEDEKDRGGERAAAEPTIAY